MKQRKTTARRAVGKKGGPKKGGAKAKKGGPKLGLRGRANSAANKGQSRASMANRTRAVNNRP